MKDPELEPPKRVQHIAEEVIYKLCVEAMNLKVEWSKLKDPEDRQKNFLKVNSIQIYIVNDIDDVDFDGKINGAFVDMLQYWKKPENQRVLHAKSTARKIAQWRKKFEEDDF